MWWSIFNYNFLVQILYFFWDVMKILNLLFLISAAALPLGGCGLIAKDLRHPGGAVGAVLDERIYDASSSKELILLRATILTAMVARAGTVYSRDDNDATAYIRYLVGVTDELNILAGHINFKKYENGNEYACEVEAAVPPVPPSVPDKPDEDDPLSLKDAVNSAEGFSRSAQKSATEAEKSATKAADSRSSAKSTLKALQELVADLRTKLEENEGRVTLGPVTPGYSEPDSNIVDLVRADLGHCITYKVNFESDLPQFERRLFRLVVAALPQEEAQEFIAQVSSGNVLGAVTSAASFASDAFDGLHTGAAVYRTGLEIVVRQWTALDHGPKSKACEKAIMPKATVYEAAECMGLSRNKLFVGKHDDRKNYIKDVKPSAFRALMVNMRDSCLSIPLGTIEMESDTVREVKKERLELCNSIEYRPKSRWEKVSSS